MTFVVWCLMVACAVVAALKVLAQWFGKDDE